MSAETEHGRIIARAARDALGPLGCFRKGGSRTWIDDHGWWAGIIEFQPSGWSKGSYLNVGACWLWYAKDHLSFDDGYRIEGFHAFRNSGQFEEVARGLAERAGSEVGVLRQRFPSLQAAAQYLRTKKADEGDLWVHYHAGVSAGLVGDVATAEARLRAVVAMPERDLPWILELKERSAALLSAAGDAPRFRGETTAIIKRARALLGLPAGALLPE